MISITSLYMYRRGAENVAPEKNYTFVTNVALSAPNWEGKIDKNWYSLEKMKKKKREAISLAYEKLW